MGRCELLYQSFRAGHRRLPRKIADAGPDRAISGGFRYLGPAAILTRSFLGKLEWAAAALRREAGP
jgi:hypothetical protein